MIRKSAQEKKNKKQYKNNTQNETENKIPAFHNNN